MTLNHAVGNIIRDLRLSKGLTLRQLSSQSHVALGYISEVERGQKNASGDVLEALAIGMDVTITELIGEIYEYLKHNE